MIGNFRSCRNLVVVSAIFIICFNVTTGFGQEYKISPGDKISIQVYGESELSFIDMPIPNSGSITYPFIGTVQASGKTESDLAFEISERLRDGFLLEPQVIISISEYRPIYVGGAIASAGQKSFLVDMDVEKVIALAGGLSEFGDINSLTILREDESGRRELKAELNWKMQPGDILTVGKIPAEDMIINSEKLYIYLYGEVSRPGRYEYLNSLSVEKAIAMAGGFGSRASKRKISVSRGEPAVKEEKVPLDYPIQPGDVITIGVSLF